MPDEAAGDRLPGERSGDVESTFHLIERARAGDQEALERLFARHLKPLQRWARGRLPRWARDLADTDDLVQDTLVQTFKNIDDFEPRRVGALQAYLRQAVLNRIRNELRRKGRQPRTTDLEGIEVDAAPVTSRTSDRPGGGRALRSRASAADGGRAGSDHRQGGVGLHLRASWPRRSANRRLRLPARPSTAPSSDWRRRWNVPSSDRVGDDLVDAILEGSPIDWTAAESSSEQAAAATPETTQGGGSGCCLRSQR